MWLREAMEPSRVRASKSFSISRRIVKRGEGSSEGPCRARRKALLRDRLVRLAEGTLFKR